MNASLVFLSNSQAMEEYQDLVALLEAHLAIVEEMVVKLQVQMDPLLSIASKLDALNDALQFQIQQMDQLCNLFSPLTESQPPTTILPPPLHATPL
ncbi:hypothetical protein Sjap_004578 [Stephania japonica]|uniref:Uncharacterized protein n=1 Tax=Stephania japonica TaxID=461633 RepID=A0AAP0K4T1_9MAGN